MPPKAKPTEILHQRINLLNTILVDIQKVFDEYKAEPKESEGYLQTCLQDLRDMYNTAKTTHHLIAAHEQSDLEIDAVVIEKYIKENVYLSIRKIYLDFSDILQTALKKCGTKVIPNEQSAVNQNEIKLPRLDIKSFHGNYEAWPEFHSIFKSAVHDNEGITNSYKLYLLKMYVKDKAAQLISNIHVDSSNYEDAWKILCDRYNHTRLLVKTQFQLLFNQPEVTSESADGLRNLFDTTNECLVSLKNLGRKVEGWDDIILYLIHSKLPVKTQQLWEEKIGSDKNPPQLTEFKSFLENRFRTLESVIHHKPNKSETGNNVKKKHSSSLQSTSNFNNCKICKQNHSIRVCEKFKNLSVNERINEVKRHKLCFNCLSAAHVFKNCSSQGTCFTCNKRHHTLLHIENFNKKGDESRFSQTLTSNSSSGQQLPSSSHSLSIQNAEYPMNSNNNYQQQSSGSFPNQFQYFQQDHLPNMSWSANTHLKENQLNPNAKTFSSSTNPDTLRILFPTALVKIKSVHNKEYIFKALIDSCSDSSYISEYAVQLLNLKRKKTDVRTSGLGDNITTVSKQKVNFDILSRFNNNYHKNISAYVLPKITNKRPEQSFTIKNLKLIENLFLADPTFNTSNHIDILLGGDVDAHIQCDGFVCLHPERLIARETKLGWIISGEIPRTLNTFLTQEIEHQNEEESLDDILVKFWELEEINEKRQLSIEDTKAENLYEMNSTRRSDGKFEVSLPFKDDNEPVFKNMKNIAMIRYISLEKRLQRDPELRLKYHNTLQEYLDLGQMTEFHNNDSNAFFLPHHPVFKESSSTTKMRIVFDGSAKDELGNSLNDTLLIGPRLQSELLDILLKFRLFKIAMTADITKMYRQIWINPNNQQYQLILWRKNVDEPIKTYALNTVTFGTSAAPYLAVKTLIKTGIEASQELPVGSKAIINGFYVDDFIYGADNVDDALQIQYEVKQILKSAGFPLTKWASNDNNVLSQVDQSEREIDFPLKFDSNSIKTLGIQWSPANDIFTFNINLPERFTKRNVLSDIARLFDPLGWIAPCIISAKLIMQKLWLKQREWDDPLIDEVLEEWIQIRLNLSKLNLVKIPRWVKFENNSEKTELHGFCDSSQKAYAAAIYLRVISNGEVHTNLIVCKTKVAPLKKVTLPRLELCGAALLCKLQKQIQKTLNIPASNNFYYSDSKIVLAWIQSDPNKRTTYVANRITTIQSLSKPNQWFYVKTDENPADLGTRGKSIDEIIDNSLWWTGPSFLSKSEVRPLSENYNTQEEFTKEFTNTQPIKLSSIVSVKSSVISLTTTINHFEENELLSKYSSLAKLTRVIAYCKRIFQRNKPSVLQLDVDELMSAKITLYKMVQHEVFTNELHLIKNNKTVNKNSRLFNLNSFIDNDGLLRVGGRIQEATHLTYDQRHPIILPNSHHVTRLIVLNSHLKMLHGTIPMVLTDLKLTYHILNCKRLVKSVINCCIKCYRFKCQGQLQQMANLPKLRVNPSRPFLNSGVDYAGPFHIKAWKGKCNKIEKCYVALFVCFSTKAIHLELVSDLSSAAFVASYKRFISRRGICSNMFSDCGTNFQGAQKMFKENENWFDKTWNQSVLKDLRSIGTQWHFNPPGSPHFGGLWEAGVKSMKHHLKRIFHDAKLTFEEFCTILTQIEACLNSRPLCQINDDDIIILTPAHFLIGSSLTTIPERNLIDTNFSYLDRWNYLQKLVQDFWKIWNNEYLTQLQQRPKWQIKHDNISIGDIVILKEPSLPPTCWLLAKVMEIHLGKDGLARVATIKTKDSIIKRPIVKLCRLPISN